MIIFGPPCISTIPVMGCPPKVPPFLNGHSTKRMKMLPEGITFSGTSAAGICLDTASLRRCIG